MATVTNWAMKKSNPCYDYDWIPGLFWVHLINFLFILVRNIPIAYINVMLWYFLGLLFTILHKTTLATAVQIPAKSQQQHCDACKCRAKRQPEQCDSTETNLSQWLHLNIPKHLLASCDRVPWLCDITVTNAKALSMHSEINPKSLRYGFLKTHDDVIKWKHFPRYWPFVRGIHWSTLNSPHKGQWRGALMFSLIYSWINGGVNNREAGDLRYHRAHYDVIVMRHYCNKCKSTENAERYYSSNDYIIATMSEDNMHNV